MHFYFKKCSLNDGLNYRIPPIFTLQLWYIRSHFHQVILRKSNSKTC